MTNERKGGLMSKPVAWRWRLKGATQWGKIAESCRDSVPFTGDYEVQPLFDRPKGREHPAGWFVNQEWRDDLLRDLIRDRVLSAEAVGCVRDHLDAHLGTVAHPEDAPGRPCVFCNPADTANCIPCSRCEEILNRLKGETDG